MLLMIINYTNIYLLFLFNFLNPINECIIYRYYLLSFNLNITPLCIIIIYQLIILSILINCRTIEEL